MIEKRKSPGLTGLTPDSIKTITQQITGLGEMDDRPEDLILTNQILELIHKNIEVFWTGKCAINELKTGTLAPVPKSGNLSDPNKWRPVCLLEITYTILASIIDFQINPIVSDEGNVVL